MSELVQIAGMMEVKIIIRGKEYIIKPLRIRDLADIEIYNMNTAKSDFERRAYEAYRHLRDNEGMTIDFVLDLYPEEFRLLTEDISKLYPDRTEVTEKNE